ncbi:hypothetical protein PHMEG_0002917 [Phytophthora megakarya]|uniref:Uncharacterized protein n=1 Tax=Phytophthora megakarya TaxID=4795 RepID=A0A225WXL8_9STRA|nr:hypothetical protein PHMEG_0002917 [Phytophthora megakarya]
MAQLQDPPDELWRAGGCKHADGRGCPSDNQVATQVSENQPDGHETDQKGDLDDIPAEALPELTVENEDHQGTETSSEAHLESNDPGFSPETTSCTPLEKSETEYERCMRFSAEELDLEPGVYIPEESEMLAQLRDQLVILPALDELHPECDIDQADVRVPDETSP